MKKIVVLLVVIMVFFFNNGELKNQLKKYQNDKTKNEANETISYEVLEKDNTQINKDNNYDNIIIDNFENISIGDNIDNVLKSIGSPARIDESEYSFKWYIYNQYGEKFAMVGIENDNVVALYSNSIDTCESEKIKLNSDINFVRNNYEPLEYKKKGNTKYIISSENQYDVINEDGKYITAFYDIYENNRVCAIQVLDEKVESSLDGIYAKESEKLRESFELQVIDLTNSVRLQRDLDKLYFSDEATISSRKHSEDMLNKNYFDHINKENQNPFDRMKKEGIEYSAAAENIAAGQTSAIYAHEAWMNSEGHRKNILGNYNHIGVGISFGGYYNLYYTQNFYYN